VVPLVVAVQQVDTEDPFTDTWQLIICDTPTNVTVTVDRTIVATEALQLCMAQLLSQAGLR
jgi:hypothetical protein